MITDDQLAMLPKIYAALQDDESRRIYKHRLMFSLTDDHSEIRRMIDECFAGKIELPPGKVCTYGAGIYGAQLLERLPDIPFVVDKRRRGVCHGRPIVPWEDFLAMPDCREYTLLLTVRRRSTIAEIARQLAAQGLRYVEAWPFTQYFDLPALNLQPDECFVDGGAFDGENTLDFFRRCPQGRAYVFEPNPTQMRITREHLRSRGNVEFFECALSDLDDTLSFKTFENDPGRNRIRTDGDLPVMAHRLDGVAFAGGGQQITFIKLDVEGAELAALRGAERTIREQRPKLAICLYHKPEDVWTIPRLVLEYNPSYKFYLRHYSLSYGETVLYAIN